MKAFGLHNFISSCQGIDQTQIVTEANSSLNSIAREMLTVNRTKLPELQNTYNQNIVKVISEKDKNCKFNEQVNEQLHLFQQIITQDVYNNSDNKFENQDHINELVAMYNLPENAAHMLAIKTHLMYVQFLNGEISDIQLQRLCMYELAKYFVDANLDQTLFKHYYETYVASRFAKGKSLKSQMNSISSSIDTEKVKYIAGILKNVSNINPSLSNTTYEKIATVIFDNMDTLMSYFLAVQIQSAIKNKLFKKHFNNLMSNYITSPFHSDKITDIELLKTINLVYNIDMSTSTLEHFTQKRSNASKRVIYNADGSMIQL
jgi:hypothetical protein